MIRTLQQKLIMCAAAVVAIVTNVGSAAEGAVHSNAEHQNGALPAGRFAMLPFGSIRPGGWMKNQLEDDVQGGLFAYYQRSWQVQNKPFSLRGHNPNKKDKHTIFWDGEADSYWGLALITSAILTDNPGAKSRADAFVAEILQSQDADGYLGIYDESSRYQPKTIDRDIHKGFLLESLFFFAQANRRDDIMRAIERAIQCDMRHFNRETSAAKGLWAQGMMVMSYPQFLDRFAEATGKKEYADYAAFIISSYDSSPDGLKVFADCTTTNLLNLQKPFLGHACNTTGNLSLPWIAYYATGDDRYRQAGENGLAKLERQESISGSLPGDEDCQGRLPLPSIAIEYCTTTYLVESALTIGDKTGRTECYDIAERALYNAGMGARLPDGTAHAYLKRDNEFNLNYPGIPHTYRYSPDHEPFCCTTRMMSLLPVFVGNMFKKTVDGSGIAAVCLGPASVHTTIDGAAVVINEKTDYPFGSHVTFAIDCDRPTTFDFYVRVPTWAATVVVHCDNATIAQRDGYYVVRKQWGTNELIDVSFSAPVNVVRWINNEFALTSGPLVFAAKIDAVPTTFNTFPSGVSTMEKSDGKLPIYGFSPGQNAQVIWDASFDGVSKEPNFGFKRVEVNGADVDRPWHDSPVRLEGMLNRMRAKFSISLVPMGCTVLRRVTFPVGQVYPPTRGKDDTMVDANTSL